MADVTLKNGQHFFSGGSFGDQSSDPVLNFTAGGGGSVDNGIARSVMAAYTTGQMSQEEALSKLQGAYSATQPGGPQVNYGQGNVPFNASTGFTPPAVASTAATTQNNGTSASGTLRDISTVMNLPALGPGSSGADVQTLQKWLVANGFMTQAQMDTGPGTYGPQTRAAVTQFQTANGIDAKGNPGYFGPISQQFLQTMSAQGGAPQGGSGTGNQNDSSDPVQSAIDKLNSMGDVGQQVASILQGLQPAIAKLVATGQIAPGLQITPELTQQFMAWAHQVVDPQTQQLITQHITDINAASQNLATQYQNNVAEATQQFGTNLANEQNAAGASGTAFSGLRNLGEQNMANSTNRTLSSLASQSSYDIGQGLRTAASAVGSPNTGAVLPPSLSVGSVSQFGGSRGSATNGTALDYGYNPSLYTVGSDISSGVQNVGAQYGKYMNDYGTLAGNSPPTATRASLIGQLAPELPAGYTIPKSLM